MYRRSKSTKKCEKFSKYIILGQKLMLFNDHQTIKKSKYHEIYSLNTYLHVYEALNTYKKQH